MDDSVKLAEVHTDVSWIKANLQKTMDRVEDIEAARNKIVGASSLLSIFISGFISWIWSQLGGSRH